MPEPDGYSDGYLPSHYIYSDEHDGYLDGYLDDII